VEEEFENFETELVGWTNGVTSSIDDGTGTTTHFLGPFNAMNPSKTWTLAEGTDSVRVTFQFYEIDSWDNERFRVRVNEQLVDLGSFYIYNTYDQDNDSGITAGIVWSHTSSGRATHLGFGSNWVDQKHNVMLDIPSSYLVSGSLRLEFDFSLDQSLFDESGGIDDLRITSCPVPSKTRAPCGWYDL